MLSLLLQDHDLICLQPLSLLPEALFDEEAQKYLLYAVFPEKSQAVVIAFRHRETISALLSAFSLFEVLRLLKPFRCN